MGDVTELKLVDHNLPSSEVLFGALKAGVNNVVVIGYDKDGDFYFASAHSSGAEVLWLLEQARYRLIETSIQLEKGEIPLV